MRLDVQPECWEEKLILFVGYLVEQNKQSSMIKSYVSAIKAILREDGIKLHEDSYLLTSLTKACRLKNDRITLHFPIHKQLLFQLVEELDHIFHGQPFLHILYRCMFLTAYCGMFQVGEITAGRHPVLAKDVHIAENKDKVPFVLHTSKTHGKHDKPQMVRITSNRNPNKASLTESERCPFAMLKRYLLIRPGFITLNEPFFIFRDRSPVQPTQFRMVLYRSLQSLGLVATLYNCHSFRIGQSCDLYQLGIPIDNIRKLGRWSEKSTTIYKYLKYS